MKAVLVLILVLAIASDALGQRNLRRRIPLRRRGRQRVFAQRQFNTQYSAPIQASEEPLESLNIPLEAPQISQVERSNEQQIGTSYLVPRVAPQEPRTTYGLPQEEVQTKEEVVDEVEVVETRAEPEEARSPAGNSYLAPQIPIQRSEVRNSYILPEIRVQQQVEEAIEVPQVNVQQRLRSGYLPPEVNAVDTVEVLEQVNSLPTYGIRSQLGQVYYITNGDARTQVVQDPVIVESFNQPQTVISRTPATNAQYLAPQETVVQDPVVVERFNPPQTVITQTPVYQTVSQVRSQPAQKPVAILRSTLNTPGAPGFERSFGYSFEAENGIQQESQGELKLVGDSEVMVMRGSYSYIGDDGLTYVVDWYADETGYHPSAPHLPENVPIPFEEQAIAVEAQIRFAEQESRAKEQALGTLNEQVNIIEARAPLNNYGSAQSQLIEVRTPVDPVQVVEVTPLSSYGQRVV